MSKGQVYILLSTFYFALMSVGVKYLSHIPSYEVVFFRGVVTLIACAIMLRRAKVSFWGNDKKNLILRGLTGTVGLLSFFYTLQHMPLASAVTIQHLSPISTIIISSFMLGEKTRWVQWIFFLVSFVGVVLVRGFDARISNVELAIGLTGATFAGLAYNYVRRLKDSDHPLVVVFYFPLVMVPIVGAYTAFNFVVPSLIDWFILAGIGLTTTMAQIYLTKAYHAERASNISNFNYLGVVYALVIGYLFFGEAVPLPGIIGIALIIGGVVVSSRFRHREPEPAK